MGYKLILLSGADKDLNLLAPPIAKRIAKKLLWISEQENPLRFSVSLHDSRSGDIRFRIGDYRVVALLDRTKPAIVVIVIGHRREIYRK